MLGSKRQLTVLGGLIILALAVSVLGTQFVTRAPGGDPFATLRAFLGEATNPALTDQNPRLPETATPFLQRLGKSLLLTFRYALIAMSMAIPLGAVLGFLASRQWWPEGKHPLKPLLAVAFIGSRLLITLLRSIHELIWVMLFFAALGDMPLTACVALALPFGGTLAKVFSELLDEQDGAARAALIATGASPLAAFFSTLLPQTLPDLASYSLYRFECALRGAAVLGFLGIETIGLNIRDSFDSLYFGEVWTELYLLIATIIIVELWGSMLRRRLNTPPPRKAAASTSLADLRRTRPRWQFVRASAWGMLTAILVSYAVGPTLARTATWERQMERVERFGAQLVPESVRDSGSWGDAMPWAQDLWADKGAEALLNTSAMAFAAIILAALTALVIVPYGSRRITTATAFDLPSGRISRAARLAWRAVGKVVRSSFVLARSVPEYVLAFLFIGLLGPGAWPIVFALALHNYGILGRLWSEVLENTPQSPARQLRLAGASRTRVHYSALLPVSFNRFLLYFFYRSETCVREATVLGMLGVASLGYYIDQSRSFLRYDRMLYFIILAALIVFALDIISQFVRHRLRKS